MVDWLSQHKNDFIAELLELPDDWLDLIEPYLNSDSGKASLKRISEFLEGQKGSFHPPLTQALAPFHRVSVKDIRVVIVGHYPYPRPAHATGLPFSNPPEASMAFSVRTIFEAVINDVGGSMPTSGCLEHLPSQGVFLINRKFTTGRTYEEFPQGHTDVGWEHFSRAIVYLIAKKIPKAAFLLWGKPAQEVTRWIGGDHLVLSTTHPSFKPKNRINPFLECRHFSTTNRFLQNNNLGPEIRWLSDNVILDEVPF